MLAHYTAPANANSLGSNMIFNLKKTWRATTALCVASTIAITNVAYAAGPDSGPASGTDAAAKLTTATPIKHVIVLIGENRGLDHTFGVYKPKGKGETIYNLLSRGIVNADGTPGPHYAGAQQYSVPAQTSYYIGATVAQKFAYTATNVMPQPNTNGAPSAQSDTGAPFKTLAEASVETDMEKQNRDLLTTGATGLQEIVWGVVPQVAPLWTSYALYRFESNARSATVLGLIGAGGIGQLLFDALNGFAYQKLSAIVVVIIVAVTLIDLLSQAMRSRLL